jgi:hypothetical protein
MLETLKQTATQRAARKRAPDYRFTETGTDSSPELHEHLSSVSHATLTRIRSTLR